MKSKQSYVFKETGEASRGSFWDAGNKTQCGDDTI